MKKPSIDWKLQRKALGDGNPRQGRLVRLLTEYPLLTWLAPYQPALVSTIVVELDTPDSDVDILCHCHNVERYEEEIKGFCADFADYESRVKATDDKETFVCVTRFTLMDNCSSATERVEIYASSTPTHAQAGYLHFEQMQRLRTLAGAGFTAAIRGLKDAGLKTEPAIARYLGLVGDPYLAVIELAACSDDELVAMVEGASNRL